MKGELALQAVDTVGGIIGGVITNKKNREFAEIGRASCRERVLRLV